MQPRDRIEVGVATDELSETSPQCGCGMDRVSATDVAVGHQVAGGSKYCGVEGVPDDHPVELVELLDGTALRASAEPVEEELLTCLHTQVKTPFTGRGRVEHGPAAVTGWMFTADRQQQDGCVNEDGLHGSNSSRWAS